jgi:predicted Zn-ribbon and HTH transcriptional regulator
MEELYGIVNDAYRSVISKHAVCQSCGLIGACSELIQACPAMKSELIKETAKEIKKGA